MDLSHRKDSDMKMKQLIDALPSIQKVAAQDMSMRTLHDISKLMNSLENELNFYSKKRDDIIHQHCANKDGKIVPLDGHSEELEAAMQELLSLDLDSFKAVHIPSDENLKISYSDLQALSGFIEIDFGEPEDEKSEER